MNTTPPNSSLPPWFPKAVVALLGLQLGLAYLQGSLLHRQQAAIRDLRADVQELTSTLEAGASNTEEGSTFSPMHHPRRPAFPIVRARYQSSEEEPVRKEKEVDQAQKDLEKSRESALKAVQDARKVQGQLSITENARKAEEKAKIENAGKNWTAWYIAGGALIIAALLGRAWLRRRG